MTRWLKALMVLSFVFVSPKSVAQEICASTPESFAAAKRAIAEINSLSRVNMIESSPSFSVIEQESRNPFTQFPPREQLLPWGTPANPYMYGQSPNGSMAQDNHAKGHDVYLGWKNLKGEGCCNGKDCGTLAEVQEASINGTTYVYVGYGDEPKAWCPVIEPYHTIKQPALSPDYNHSHACVVPPSFGGSVCKRFRCYMGRPQT